MRIDLAARRWPLRIGPSVALTFVLWALSGCDRGMAPFEPDEEPSTPDLAKIFPDQAALQGAAPPGASAAGNQTREAAAGTRGSAAESVRGEIRIGEALASQVPGDALLFIIARAPGGGPPLAVRRVEAPTFPYSFEVSAADRMIAERPFVGPFTLSAWIDSDGNVMTRGAGDYQGESAGTHAPGDRDIEIVIDQAL